MPAKSLPGGGARRRRTGQWPRARKREDCPGLQIPTGLGRGTYLSLFILWGAGVDLIKM